MGAEVGFTGEIFAADGTMLGLIRFILKEQGKLLAKVNRNRLDFMIQIHHLKMFMVVYDESHIVFY